MSDRIEREREPKPRRFRDPFSTIMIATVAFAIGGVLFGSIAEAEGVEKGMASVKIHTVPATTNEREYCESTFCVYATPDGLRVVNYSNEYLACDTIEGRGGASPNSSWWALGRPGQFLRCHQEAP